MPLATARASIASCSDGSDEMGQKGWLAKRSVYLTLDALLLSYTISLTGTHLYLAVTLTDEFRVKIHLLIISRISTYVEGCVPSPPLNCSGEYVTTKLR